MTDWLSGPMATGATAISLVVMLLIAQVRGWLWVKPQVDEFRRDWGARLQEVREDRDARLADKDRQIEVLWAAFHASEQAREIGAAQMEQMLQGLETTMAVVQAIPTGSGRHV